MLANSQCAAYNQLVFDSKVVLGFRQFPSPLIKLRLCFVTSDDVTF